MTNPSPESRDGHTESNIPYQDISVRPQADQKIQHNDSVFTTIREGLAHILIPADAPTTLDTKQYQQAQKDKTKSSLVSQSVFYNPIQQFNRDLSVLAIRAYSEHVIAVREASAKKKAEKRALKPRRPKDGKTVDQAGSGGPEGGEQGAGRERRQEPLPATLGAAKRKADDEAAFSTREVPASKRVRFEDENGPDQQSSQLLSKKRKETDEHTQNELDEHVTKRARTHNDDHATGQSGQDGVKSSEPTTSDASSEGLEDAQTSTDTQSGHRSVPFRILDALSATGLRALRYAQEIPLATSTTANDLSAEATDSIKVNVEHNRLSEKIKVTTGDARGLMYNLISSKDPKYDVIDLDPYGTAVPFLDAAIQALNDGGLLCVTCTDAGVWASHGYSEKTFSLYGGNPIKGRHSHEGGLRLILHSIATTAARYGIAIEPLTSLSIDFYARLFVRVYKSPEQVKFLAGKTMLVYSCDSGCGAWSTQMIGRNIKSENSKGGRIYRHGMAQAPSCSPHCEHCGFKTHLCGPMWAGPLHNPYFLETLQSSVSKLDKNVYATKDRIDGMVSTALEETTVEDYTQLQQASSSDTVFQDPKIIPSLHPAAIDLSPFFVIPHSLAGIIHCQAPGEHMLKGAIRHAGFRAARSHCQPGSVKTNAPWTFVWRMMREWVRQKAPLKEGSLKPTSAGYGIMQHTDHDDQGKDVGSADATPKHDGEKAEPNGEGSIVFDELLGRDKQSRKLMRYQLNPRENWGPMNRAKR
ncbi:MAG: hypothetical protein Q9162_007185 [Coniocarpon cinnabarinum]